MAASRWQKNESLMLSEPQHPPSYETATSQPGLNILLVSKTGGGKSSLGNALLELRVGDPDTFTVVSGLESGTDFSKSISRTIAGKRYTIIDTPGTMDTANPDKALEEIARAIVICPNGFHVILLVIRIDCRFTPEEKMAIKLLVKMFGDEFYKFCILVFSHGDEIDNDDEKFRTHVSKAKNKFELLEDLLNRSGNRAALIDNGRNLKQEVQAVQLKKLRALMDERVSRNNGAVYTNRYFTVAKEIMQKERRKQEEQERREMEEFQRILQEEVRERQLAEFEAMLNDYREQRRAEFEKLRESKREQQHLEAENRATAVVVKEVKADGNSCFPADATAQTPEGPVRMSQLRLGQLVLAQAPDGRPVYSPVYTWGHRDPHDSPSAWTVVHTSSGASITLSSDHLLPLATDDSSGVAAGSAAARRLRAGASAVWTLEDGGRCVRRDLVTSVRALPGGERPLRGGLFAPFTLCGNLFVDGVLASCYVDCGLPAPLLHGLLWPVRSAWRVWPAAVEAAGCPDADAADGGMPGWVRVAAKRLLPWLQRLMPAVEGGLDVREHQGCSRYAGSVL